MTSEGFLRGELRKLLREKSSTGTHCESLDAVDMEPVLTSLLDNTLRSSLSVSDLSAVVARFGSFPGLSKLDVSRKAEK